MVDFQFQRPATMREPGRGNPLELECLLHPALPDHLPAGTEMPTRHKRIACFSLRRSGSLLNEGWHPIFQRSFVFFQAKVENT